ncbi:hypothetical protein SAMN05444359_10878 [Neolewinella agarilytica]|uniref:Uncharacterized protein n=1 Tax=Neolewinella agarilytica TaxID=478744 RepID=A0A1H9F4J7_9BACT|nr:hypothetical protein SAMN05444359_10878 [Neolewinella agarilytica]
MRIKNLFKDLHNGKITKLLCESKNFFRMINFMARGRRCKEVF